MLSLTFLGTGASIPTLDRNVAGIAIQREGEMLLFDCGEGNQRQMMRYGVGFTFKEIFFTHYHADTCSVSPACCAPWAFRTGAPRGRSTAPGCAADSGRGGDAGIERNKFPIEIIEISR